jgi:hypothetical protein
MQWNVHKKAPHLMLNQLALLPHQHFCVFYHWQCIIKNKIAVGVPEMNIGAKTNKYIPLEEAKASIVSALNEYHPELGTRAAEILYNEERINIREVSEDTPDRTGMMQCRPAGINEAWLTENDMLISDFKERFGDYFEGQTNDAENAQAIIDYEYDGTQQSIVYLAHELGHAIADDIQTENGKSFLDFTPNECEEQAYFIQSIYTHVTGKESTESAYLEERNKGTLQEPWARANLYENSNKEFKKGLACSHDDRKNLFTKALGGTLEQDDHFQKQTHQGNRPNIFV